MRRKQDYHLAQRLLLKERKRERKEQRKKEIYLLHLIIF